MITNHAFTAIQALDLVPIKTKLMHQKFGEGWSQTKADAMETEYRRFLYLQLAFPGEQTAPTRDVDTFWHYHILDTVKYAADCEQAFGYFLHHCPELDTAEDQEAALHSEAGNRTRALYEATFGEAYLRAEAYGGNDDGITTARCQGPCIVARPAAQGAASADCQGLCVANKPAAKRFGKAVAQLSSPQQRH